jgi:hypothetical protein
LVLLRAQRFNFFSAQLGRFYGLGDVAGDEILDLRYLRGGGFFVRA